MVNTNFFLLQPHFTTLGITSTTDIRTIKAAYTRKALALHPDKTGDPSILAAFTAVQEAWEALRAEYKTKLKTKPDPDHDFSAWNKWRPVPGETLKLGVSRPSLLLRAQLAALILPLLPVLLQQPHPIAFQALLHPSTRANSSV